MSEDFYDEPKRDYPEIFKEKKKHSLKYGKLYILPLTLMAFLILGTLSILGTKNNNDVSLNKRVTMLENMVYNNSKNINQIKSDLDTCKMKVHMLGVLHNENWTIYKTGKCRGHLMFIYDDGQWFVKHMPHYIYIDPVTGRYMEENYVKP